MVSVALKISDDFRSLIEKLPWVNWSELARENILEKIEKSEALERFMKIVSKSKFTEKDALELAKKVNKGMHKRYKKLYSGLQ